MSTENQSPLDASLLRPGPFAEAFQVSDQEERESLVAGLVEGTNRFLLVGRARAIAGRLKSRGVPYSVLYDFELILARNLHPGSRRHRGADYFLDGYYRERVQPYRREIRRLEKEGELQNEEIVPVLAEIDANDGLPLVRLFLDRSLRQRYPDSADLLRTVEDRVQPAKRREEENPQNILLENYRALREEEGETAASLFRLRVEHDDRLRPYAGALHAEDEAGAGDEGEAGGGEDARDAAETTTGAGPEPAVEEKQPAARSAPAGSGVDLNALYGWALKHIKQFEERYEEDEDRAALANRLLSVFRKLNQERGREPALATLDRVIEGSEAANLLPETVAILNKIRGSASGATPPPSAPPDENAGDENEEVIEPEFEDEEAAGEEESAAENEEVIQPEFEDEEAASEEEAVLEPSDEPAPAGPEFEEAPEPPTPEPAVPEVIEPTFEEAPADAAPEDAGDGSEGDGFPPEPSEKEVFLAEKRDELAGLEQELRLELGDIEAEADRIRDAEPDEVKARKAIEALNDPRFAPYHERLLAELAEADDLFRRIMGLLSELSRRLTLQELRSFVDGLIAELKENAELIAEHPHLIERLTNYRNSLQDDPPELLREIHGRLDEIRRASPDYIPGQLAYLKERLSDETYRKLWPTIFNIYQNILQQKLDLTLSGIASRPAPEQLEMYGALKQGFAPGSPVRKELEARLRGAELAGVADRLDRERAGETPTMADVLQTLGGDPVESFKKEIRQYDPGASRERRQRNAALNAPDIEPAAKEELLAGLRESDDPEQRGEYIMHQLGDHGGSLSERLKALDLLEGKIDPVVLDAKRQAVRDEAARDGAPARLFRLLNESDPGRRAVLEREVAGDANIPEELKAATAAGGTESGAGFDEAFMAITASSHPPANKLNFLKALANIAKKRDWLNAERGNRLRQAIEKYGKIVAGHAQEQQAFKARNHYYYAKSAGIAGALARGDDRGILDGETEHVHDYTQAQRTIALAGSLGAQDAGSLPPFLRAAIPSGFQEQVDTVLKKKGKSSAAPGGDPGKDPAETDFRRELEGLAFPASRDDLRRLYQKFDDPRRRKILNQMNALSRERENRIQAKTGAPPAVSQASPGTGGRAAPSGPARPAPAAAPSALDNMLDSALSDSSALADMEVDDFDPGIKVKHSIPAPAADLGGPAMSIAEPEPVKSAAPASPGPSASSGLPSPSAPGQSSGDEPEFVSVAPEFEPESAGKKSRKKSGGAHHDTRAPSWDERIAGGLSKLGGSLRESLAQAGGGKKKEARPKKDDDWKTFSVSKLGAKATKDFYDFSGKKKAEDIFAKLLTQESLIKKIKNMPEFKQAQQDPKKVDQIADSVKNNIAVTVMTPKDVRPIGFPDTVCFPRKDWFDDLKRKRLVKAAREMAKKNTPGNERYNYYMWLADEIEMHYYQSKYKRGKLD